MSFKIKCFAVIFALVVGYSSAKPDLASPSKFRGSKGAKRESGLGIYDGTNTTIEDHPYMVGLLYEGDFLCGGVILSESWVITDADCLYGYSTSEFKVVAGSSNGQTGTKYKVKKMVIHPSYDTTDYKYDYGLVEIKGSFSWSSSVGNISLPSKQLAANTEVVVVGYGDTSSENGLSEGTLMQGNMKYLAIATCEKWYEGIFDWNKSMACAYNKGNVTICNGDFGDPFIHEGVLYGIALGGQAFDFCCLSAYPAVMSDVYLVVDWIQKHTGAQIEKN